MVGSIAACASPVPGNTADVAAVDTEAAQGSPAPRAAVVFRVTQDGLKPLSSQLSIVVAPGSTAAQKAKARSAGAPLCQ